MDLVKGVTSDHDLIALAKKLKVHIDDIKTIDEIHKPLPRGEYIILLRTDNGIGHWVAIHNDEYFDSTGVGPPTKLGPMRYNEFQYQSTYGEYCGVWSMLFLYARQKNRPELLKGFNNLDVDILS